MQFYYVCYVTLLHDFIVQFFSTGRAPLRKKKREAALLIKIGLVS